MTCNSLADCGQLCCVGCCPAVVADGRPTDLHRPFLRLVRCLRSVPARGDPEAVDVPGRLEEPRHRPGGYRQHGPLLRSSNARRSATAGFDGIHYEWHSNPVKPPFREALQKTNLPVAMFYDMEIRFSGQGAVHHADGRVRQDVRRRRRLLLRVRAQVAVAARSQRLPAHCRLRLRVRHARHGPAAWDRFYRAIISGVEQQLGEQVVFHWTNNGSLQQMYGFQHFPEIQSYVFNEVNQQSPVNAHSVTFVVHYDDLGVSFARAGGPRATRWIRNDIRYLAGSALAGQAHRSRPGVQLRLERVVRRRAPAARLAVGQLAVRSGRRHGQGHQGHAPRPTSLAR